MRSERSGDEAATGPGLGSRGGNGLTAASQPASVIEVAGVRIGAGNPVAVIAGPCSVEGKAEFRESAEAVKAAGAHLLRGGAFKPRTSPYSFQGLGVEGLEIMREVADDLGMGVVTEALDLEHVRDVAQLADVIQIGTRNMENEPLLEAAAATGRPILLKRSMTATLDQFVKAANFIVSRGNPNVMMCERGLRTFEPAMRNTFDVVGIVELLEKTPFVVVADPSHATGRRDLVVPLARAGVAAGAHALLIEAHVSPESALSDAAQTISPDALRNIVETMELLSATVGARSE